VTRTGLVAAVLVVSACRHPAPPPKPTVEVPVPALPVEPPWVKTISSVRAALDAGQFGIADSILAAFERSEAGTPDASEGAFWRAMLRADPRNPAFSPSDARMALDAYIALPDARRRPEAMVMLRLLTLSDSLRSSGSAQRSAADARDRAKDDELLRLRDELQKTQAELDRIKRRLGNPKP